MAQLTKEQKLKKLYDLRMRLLRHRAKVVRSLRLYSEEIFESEDSISAWREILKNHPDQWYYKRFLRFLAQKRGIRVLPGKKGQP